ncbi:MAG: (d)CMP kinase [Clostridiales bacterium]|jgi:cytidylate kinase|nr:(d)CMP kinase [Clostridiales bacterium]
MENVENMQTIKIAIDGPAGAGKTTISKELARFFGFLYVDTGAMYRAVALKAIRNHINLNDEDTITDMLETTSVNLKSTADGGYQVLLDDEDVSSLIRTLDIATAASQVATIQSVRIKLVEFQRKIAATDNVIMDGRDIGSYVLPHANIKIFLTATIEDRAVRRFKELQERGSATTFEQVKRDIKFRDKNDSSRAFAPLMVARDAMVVDTSDNSLDTSIELLKEIIREKLYELLYGAEANA